MTRFLRNFEAPFISLSTANQKYNENGHYHFLCIRLVIFNFFGESEKKDVMSEMKFLFFRNYSRIWDKNIPNKKKKQSIVYMTLLDLFIYSTPTHFLSFSMKLEWIE